MFRRSTVESADFDVDAEVGPGETLTSRLRAGFELSVDGLFAD